MAFYNEHSDITNFVVSFMDNPKDDFGIFSKGYRMAANKLASALLERSQFSDYEAYPIVFLFRHALELSLKHIIFRSKLLAAFKFRDDIDIKIRNTHDLEQLSASVANLLRSLFPEDEDISNLIRNIITTCTEISKIDPISESYRYPTNKKGLPSSKRHQVVNLRSFAKHMASILDDLDTIHFGLNIEIDIAQEVFENIQNKFDSRKKANTTK